MIRLTRTGLVASATDAELRHLRQQFGREHVIRLPGLLDPVHVGLVQRYIDLGQFVHRVHDDIGTEHCLVDGPAARLLFFVVNDPTLWRVVEQVTGCDRIGCFTGRVYRMIPHDGTYDTWHSDMAQHRMVGMSVNLGREPYAGGVFQLRNADTGAMLCEAPNVGPGDAILFRIAANLEHWITPLEGTVPKTAFAGWFRSAPDFLSLLRAGPSVKDVDD
jgi:hypothetical protein